MLAHCFGSLVLNKGVNNMNNPQTIFLSIAISIGVFLLLREVLCWYFKINKKLSVLLDIKDELVKANNYSNPNKEPAMANKHFKGVDVKANFNFDSGKTASAYVDKPKESFWRAK
jgi:hypothetical protein